MFISVFLAFRVQQDMVQYHFDNSGYPALYGVCNVAVSLPEYNVDTVFPTMATLYSGSDTVALQPN